jgi:hypothetical protein
MATIQRACPTCDHDSVRRLSRKAWLAAGAALAVAGLFIPFAMPVFVGAGILLMLATPLLPELYRCGAHFVADTIADLPRVLAEINEQLQRGMCP